MPICSTCPTNTQQAIQFHPDAFGKRFGLTIKIGLSHSGTGAVQVHKWNQKPNSDFNGRSFCKTVSPNAQGLLKFSFSPSSDFPWLSFFQRNPAKSNAWDCCCVSINNSLLVITLESF